MVIRKPLPLSKYIFLIQNFTFSSSGHFGPNALTPTWSLAVEEHFYLLIPMLIRLFSVNRLFISSIFFIILAFIFRSFASNWYMEYTHSIERFDSLFIGVLLAIIIIEREIYEDIFRSKTLITGLFSSLLIIYFFISKSINHALISFVFFYTIYLTFELKESNYLIKFLSCQFLHTIGKLSFTIYLFHQLFNGVLFYCLQNNNSPNLNNYTSYLLEAASLSLTFLFSVFTFNLLEKKLTDIGRTFTYKN